MNDQSISQYIHHTIEDCRTSQKWYEVDQDSECAGDRTMEREGLFGSGLTYIPYARYDTCRDGPVNDWSSYRDASYDDDEKENVIS